MTEVSGASELYKIILRMVSYRVRTGRGKPGSGKIYFSILGSHGKLKII